MADDARKCCGVPKEAEHANGCRYSPLSADGTKKPLTPKRQREVNSANREADQQAEETFDEPSDKKDDLPDEREEWFRAPGLQRMKMGWTPDEQAHMLRVHGAIERKVFETFADALAVMNDIWDVVREQDVDETTGVLRVDAHGFKVWKKHPASGAYYEDWTQLTHRQREDFLFRITTNLFDWEQRAVGLWTEAMFSKAMFTERFAIEYDTPMSGTIDDRNAVGNRKAAEDRYFALMQTAASRRADAIVRTMTNLMLRIKETLAQ